MNPFFFLPWRDALFSHRGGGAEGEAPFARPRARSRDAARAVRILLYRTEYKLECTVLRNLDACRFSQPVRPPPLPRV